MHLNVHHKQMTEVVSFFTLCLGHISKYILTVWSVYNDNNSKFEFSFAFERNFYTLQTNLWYLYAVKIIYH